MRLKYETDPAWRALKLERDRARVLSSDQRQRKAKKAKERLRGDGEREKRCEWERTYREKNRIRLNANAARWRENNPEKMRAAQARYHQSEKGLLSLRLNQGRRRARMQGVVTREEWLAKVAEFNRRCVYCKQEFPVGKLTMDHVLPVLKGGLHVIANIVPACLGCNSRKGSKT
jgi:5-methylcytosine-specific restriction endonuclease McrA